MWQKPDLRMNLIPISFTAEKFKGHELPYDSEDQLKALREKYRESHIFRRQGNIIQCVLLTDGAEALGKEKEFTIKDDFVLAERLVQAALINFFKERGMQFSRLFSPATLIVDRENLIKKVVNDENIASLIPMYPEYQLEGRLVVPHDKDVIFGILLNFGVFHLIDATVQDLIDKKVDVVDCYVVTDAGDKKGSAISEKFRKKPLAGKIAAIQGSKLKLIDYRDSEEIDASSCYLEPSSRNFRRCLATLCDKDIKDLQQRRMEQIFEVTGAKKQYDRLEKVKEWLKKSEPIRCGGGLSFNIKSEIYQLRAGNEAGEYRQLDNPTYVLRPGNQLSFRGRIDKGIDENGPYDAESFPTKWVRIALLYPERFKGETEVFIKQFKEGVPPRPNKEIPFTQGFTRKYHLTNCEIEPFSIQTAKENIEGYKQASLEALEKSPGLDLAIVVTKENFHSLRTQSNPYFGFKACFMSQGVPVQSIEIETIMDQRGRPWILNNLALATYAKLGGIPYVLTSAPGMTHELIFGIGSSNIKTRRLGESERFVGITTVFNGDGNYLLYNLTKEVKYENYQNALLQSLRECMDEVKARYGWQKGDKVRLIFHQSFKKFKSIEAQAVKEFVSSITDFDVEYAFVHISRSHPWKVYDKNSEGVPYWNNNRKFIKGEYVPQRGFYIPLGPQAALLTLTGPSQLKTHLQGCPEPILISIHSESTFFSQEYLANQIYRLTFMSWKSFSPSTMPVTIEYSAMIADLMGHLRAIPNWNPDILRTKLRESRWFL
jgi:hypothetical protein